MSVGRRSVFFFSLHKCECAARSGLNKLMRNLMPQSYLLLHGQIY